MAKVKVCWTRLALDDLDHALEYIAADNPSAAARVIKRIKRAVDFLPSHPDLGRRGRGQGTRELVIPGTPFIIPYRISRSQVEILALMHAARRWPDTF